MDRINGKYNPRNMRKKGLKRFSNCLFVFLCLVATMVVTAYIATFFINI